MLELRSGVAGGKQGRVLMGGPVGGPSRSLHSVSMGDRAGRGPPGVIVGPRKFDQKKGKGFTSTFGSFRERISGRAESRG